MKAFLPREHGLWAWVGVPVVAALGLAPSVATLVGALGVAVAFFFVNALRVHWPRTPWFEVPGILGLGGVGAGLAVLGGADPHRAVAVQFALGTWQVLGLWWVRGLLAPILPGRRPWTSGKIVGICLAVTSFAVGLALGEPLAGAVPLLYPLRMAATPLPRKARDARRMGIGELAWAVGAAALAVSA